MRIWAAIDVLGGRVVTLTKGDFSSKKDWGMRPDEAAVLWEQEGADGLHLIDLDRILGKGSNAGAIGRVVGRAGIPVQVGGGIRTVNAALEMLEMGAARVVIGTSAFSEPMFLRQVLQRAGPRRVAVAVDFRGDTVVTHGWKKVGGTGVIKAVSALDRAGVEAIVATAVERDGTGSGPDLATCRMLRRASAKEMVASGGIRSVADVMELRDLGLDGVILGRALYEGTIRLGDLEVS